MLTGSLQVARHQVVRPAVDVAEELVPEGVRDRQVGGGSSLAGSTSHLMAPGGTGGSAPECVKVACEWLAISIKEVTGEFPWKNALKYIRDC